MTESELIKENYGLAVAIANKFFTKNSMWDMEDLIQVALMSMIKAHRKFDEEKAVFSTFATICMRNDLIKFIKKNKPNPYGQHFGPPQIEDPVDEYIPDNLTPQESAIVYYQSHGYKDEEIRSILNLISKDFRPLIKSCYKKIRMANA